LNESDKSEDIETQYAPYTENLKIPKLVSQPELNDLIRDLGLPKDGAEYLASFLKARNFLKPGMKVSFYRDRDKQFRKNLIKDKESSLMYCSDIKGLINELKKNCYRS